MKIWKTKKMINHEAPILFKSLAIISALVVSVSLGYQTKAQAPDIQPAGTGQPDRPEIKNTQHLLKEWIEAAQLNLERYQKWPTVAEDGVEQHGHTIAPKELMKRLTSTLNKRNSFDAHLKSRLVSFAPIWKAEDVKGNHDFMRIVTKVPDLYDWPDPPVKKEGSDNPLDPAYIFSGTQRNVITNITGDAAPNTVVYAPSTGTLTSGMLLTAGEKGVKIQRSEIQKLRDAIGSFQRNIIITQTNNVPTLKLRKQLYTKLPAFSGPRLVLAAEDTYQRMKAGDPSFEDALIQLASEAAGYKDLGMKTLKESERRKVLGLVRRIEKIDRTYIIGMKVSDGGVVTAESRKIKADAELIKMIVSNLMKDN